jgi:[acyl-carrier-protein] S-malonyltransferase
MSGERTAYMFPGQGSQTSDLRERVRAHWPELERLCIDAVGEDPFDRASESTRFAQPAILCGSLAMWRALGEPLGDVMAGHSLGELSALTAAGAVDVEDAVGLVALRGRLMAEAAEGRDGGMLALLKAGLDDALALASAHRLQVANDNAPGQLVLSGPRRALDAAAEQARASGLRAMRLDVAGAFHSDDMSPAVEPMRRAIAAVAFRRPRVPVYSSLTARPFAHPPTELADALVGPVRWREVVEQLAGAGVVRFVDVGPGRVLARLVERTLAEPIVEIAEEQVHVAA